MVRGQLYYDQNGRLWEVDPNASDPTNPSQSELQPVTIEQLQVTSINEAAIDHNETDNRTHDGDDLTPKSVSTEDVNRDGSYREGSRVYYDAQNPGPYTDGQAALADVPDGGELHLAATEFDVASEGRLSNDRGIKIIGEGWNKDENGDYQGTIIVNTGSDAVDNPVMQVTGTNSNREQTEGQMGGWLVRHGGSSPAVEIADNTNLMLQDAGVDCGDGGTVGFKWSGSAFFARAVNCWVGAFSDKGFYVENGAGSQHVFLNCQSSSAFGNTGLVTEQPDTHILYGQHDADLEGVRFDNPTSSNQKSGTVYGTLFEGADTQIVADGSNSRADRVRAIGTRHTIGSGETAMQFGNSFGSRLIEPTVINPAGGTVAEWTGNSINCGAKVTKQANSGGYTVQSGAFDAWLQIDDRLPDSTISNLPTSLFVEVKAATDHNHLRAHYDTAGGSWTLSDGTTFTP